MDFLPFGVKQIWGSGWYMNVKLRFMHYIYIPSSIDIRAQGSSLVLHLSWSSVVKLKSDHKMSNCALNLHINFHFNALILQTNNAFGVFVLSLKIGTELVGKLRTLYRTYIPIT